MSCLGGGGRLMTDGCCAGRLMGVGGGGRFF